jgi:hypothetical protein
VERRDRSNRVLSLAAALVAGAMVVGCASQPSQKTSMPLAVLHREDMLWLERVSFGLDSVSVTEYRRLGRTHYLEHELQPQAPALPAPIAAEIDALEVNHVDPLHTLADVNAQYKVINAMADGPDKEAARKTLNDHGNKLAYEAVRRDLLRAVYSPAQL